nr:MAG TPA: hypothetical protein [Caudoviricetes sp.]
MFCIMCVQIYFTFTTYPNLCSKNLHLVQTFIKICFI